MIIHEDVVSIGNKLIDNGFQAYLVGGAVRDLLMKKVPHDWDIATNATPSEIKEIFPDCHNVREAFGVIVVHENGSQYEIATLREDHGTYDGRHPAKIKYTDEIEVDLARRDFTINAIAIDLADGSIIDPFKGQKDIDNKIIRAVGNSYDRFMEDHLRMLRAIRFSLALDFELEETLEMNIKTLGSLVGKVSAERWTAELLKILPYVTASNYELIKQLAVGSGMFHRYLPEVYLMLFEKQDKEYHPEGNVLTHSLLAVANLESDDPILKLIALLHDVGKITCSFYRPNPGKIVSYDHDTIGSRMIEDIFARLKLSNADRKRAVALIRDHMLPFFKLKETTFIQKIYFHDYRDDLLALHKADIMASRGDLTSYNEVIERIKELDKKNVGKPIVDGKFLISLGFSPSATFKNIIDKCRIAQVQGRITDEKSAEEFIKSII